MDAEAGRPEGKAAVAAFISLCLSCEGQTRASRDLDFGLSVHRDVIIMCVIIFSPMPGAWLPRECE